MGKIGLYVDWLGEAESPQEGVDWTNINSYEKFKVWVNENKCAPQVLNLGFQLSEDYQRWILNPENEDTPIDYPALGSGSCMSILVFTYHLCTKNGFSFPEIQLHSEFEPGNWDMRRFVELICRKEGWTPNIKVKHLNIKDDWEQGENWQTFLKIKNEFINEQEEYENRD